jgi:hypothetical protein
MNCPNQTDSTTVTVTDSEVWNPGGGGGQGEGGASERRPGNRSRRRAKHVVEEGRRRPWVLPGQEVPFNTLMVVETGHMN